jgi:hypothetical protein
MSASRPSDPLDRSGGSRRTLTRGLRATATGAVLALVGSVLVGLTASPAQAAGRATPRNFTGYGFDQCVAPTQSAMDAWLRHSPFWAVGVYTTGDSRFCRDQPNLTPTWVETQLRNGWRILPITLGPQASCTTRDRYRKQERINPDPTKRYAKARAQGRREARTAVAEAARLGMGPKSTLWYDLEGDFSVSNTNCRESALSFVSAWTNELHELGYRSGYYSSAGTGIKMLDDARVNRPGRYAMPDQLWVARWSGVPGRINDPGMYLREDGWQPHARVHQYRGGHNETHGGVTINIDSNWLDVGKGTVAPRSPKHCGGVDLDLTSFPKLTQKVSGAPVAAAQCLLSKLGHYDGAMTGVYDAATIAAVRAYRAELGMSVRNPLPPKAWTALLSRGGAPLMKFGAGSHAVRRLQRALNAADGAGLAVTGVFEGRTTEAVQAYQRDHGLRATGVVLEDMWALLKAGTR